MLTVEKDNECEEIFIHGSPDKLRWLASRITAVAEEAESQGQAHDHLMTEEWAGSELDSDAQGSNEGHEIVNKLTIYAWRANG